MNEHAQDAPEAASLPLTVVVPAYNEAARLPATLERMVAFFCQQPYRWRIVVVDDGSADATAELAQEWAARDPRVQVIKNDHRGKAFAVRTGILAADTTYVAFSDADMSVPIGEIERLLAALADGYDVAIGSREGPGAHRYDEPAYRHLIGRVYNWLYSRILLPGIGDAQCGFKAFRTPAARDLFGRMLVYGADAPLIRGGMVTGFDTELLFLARRRGYKVAEVGVDWYYGKGTKVRLVHDSLRMFVDVLKILVNARTGRYDGETGSP